MAGAGVVVAKHGNRSVSSRCGSADILEAVGVNINVEEQHLSACLDELGVAFLFAQQLHPAMKNVAVIRKELGVETIFNILGPLTNPAKATHQILGVYNRDLVEPMANVLKNLGLKRALVVHGSDGLDEITSTAQTFIGEYDGKEVFTYDIMPDEFGLPPAQPHDLEGGDLATNVRIFEDILAGKKALNATWSSSTPRTPFTWSKRSRTSTKASRWRRIPSIPAKPQKIRRAQGIHQPWLIS